MNRLLIALLLALSLSPAVFAQENGLNHGEAGVFADYFRMRQAVSNNFWGIGGRFSFNVHSNVQLEAEMVYDFGQTVTEGFTSATFPSLTNFAPSNVRILHGLFGPKLQTGGGAMRLFVTLKGGFINFRFDQRPVTFTTFSSTLGDLRSSNVDAVLYPGGGVELYLGPVGLRLDIGDEIYFNHGGNNNLRMTFGPQIRF